MSERRRSTAVMEREGDGFVSPCPEVDVASQGDTIEEARANLQEAVELFFETASAAEISERPARRGLRDLARCRISSGKR